MSSPVNAVSMSLLPVTNPGISVPTQSAPAATVTSALDSRAVALPVVAGTHSSMPSFHTVNRQASAVHGKSCAHMPQVPPHQPAQYLRLLNMAAELRR